MKKKDKLKKKKKNQLESKLSSSKFKKNTQMPILVLQFLVYTNQISKQEVYQKFRKNSTNK